MYQAGELDTSDIPFADLEWVRAHPELSKELHVESALGTAYMAFDVSQAPVNDPLVRKALAAATDKQKMVDNVLRGGEIPAKSFGPPGVFGSPAEDPDFMGIPFDPQQARKWLAEAGYPDGQGFPELVMMYATSEGNKLLGEFVQQQWKDLLGIEVKAMSQEFRVFLQTVREDPPHAWGLVWVADYPDENNFLLEFCHPTKGINSTRWNVEDAAAKRFMDLTEAAAAEPDPQKRKALYSEAEKILCEDEAIMIPLWYMVDIFLTKPYVERTYNLLAPGFASWRVLAH
jgi:oligopeptide transport system substrate-binding protein